MKPILNMVRQAIEDKADFRLFKNVMPNTIDLKSFQDRAKFFADSGDPHKINGYRDELILDDYNKFKNIENFLDEFLELDQFKDNFYLTTIYSSPIWIDKPWSEYHNDNSINISWQCHGSVEWKIGDESGPKETIVVEAGDVLYLKDFIYHSTSVLSERAGIILMDKKTY